MHTDTAIYPETLGLLTDLMRLPAITPFNLGGGTALALQLSHRLSIDLDFFCPADFDTETVLAALKTLGDTEVLIRQRNSLSVKIRGVKVDFLTYAYPNLQPIVVTDGLRLLAMPDIAAMKLSAVANRGLKRDFFDLYFLLQEYSLADMLRFFTAKFQIRDTFHICKSLTYFADAEKDRNPQLLKKVAWKTVKAVITKAVKDVS